MPDIIPYLVYFLGPFLLAYLLGKRLLGATYSAFAIGLLAFFVAWVCILIVTQIPAALSDSLKLGTILGALAVSASAALFEESSRYFAFRIFKSLRENRNWNTGIMYSIGHSGMESIMVGAQFLLTIAIVKYAPQMLSLEFLSQCKEMLEISFLYGLYLSFERLLVGLLIHSCFTSVVLLSLIKSKKKYLWLAMLWHFGHNMVGFNLHRLSDHWLPVRLWIAFIVVVYTWSLFRLRRVITNEET